MNSSHDERAETTLPRIPLPADYALFLEQVKERVHQAQVRAALAVSRELVSLYWQIGRDLQERQQGQGWGDAVIRQLAQDISKALPGVEGFSYRNLYRMRALYLAYPDESHFVTQPVSQIPWGHSIVLLQKVKDSEQRLWYAAQSLQQGWSRAILEYQIEGKLFERQGKATTNFQTTLPAPQSDMAQQVLKDPFNFDFLTLGTDAHERDLERGLLSHIRQFLLELGVGFAFVGSQYHIEIGGQDFYLDLVFYHLKLRCFVVIDLKMRAFTPEDAGKMNFYLSATDDLLRHEMDGPSIGLILCKVKNTVIAEYALREMSRPIGVSTVQLTAALPETLQGSLPTIAELEAELSDLGKETERLTEDAGD